VTVANESIDSSFLQLDLICQVGNKRWVACLMYLGQIIFDKGDANAADLNDDSSHIKGQRTVTMRSRC